MGKVIQIQPDFIAVLLPDGKRYSAGQQTTLTDAEYSSLPIASTRALTIITSGVTDPVRASALAPQSLADAQANAIATAAADATTKAAAEATARTAADALLIPLTQRGAASGVATLDSGSKVPVGQIPSLGVISRSINSISAPVTAGAAAFTDYYYFVSGTTTLTLPTAVGNTNRYSVKNVGVATVTIATTSSQTIDGSATQTLPVTNQSLDLISDGANWRII